MIHGLLLDSERPTLTASLSPRQSYPPTWRTVGVVRDLHTRVGKEPAPRRVSSLQVLANYGIVGDRHASPTSPRQILLAGEIAYRRFRLPEAALRENLLVDFSMDLLRSGDLLRIGSDVILWVTFQCEPCSLLERRCPGTIKSIGPERGMLARVLRGGVVLDGDTVSLTSSPIPAMSNDWQTRILKVARAVPPKHYIGYRQLAELAGVANAYCRAFPRVLARLPAEIGGRVLSASAVTSEHLWDGADLFDTSALFMKPEMWESAERE
ncbi:MOSC domain-containing protein [Polaromonas sp.]|uniref:MOSC domain-containing protein n=1 Tax=Polaromonas sp. TaxID=1869339 RepID=UPI0032635989